MQKHTYFSKKELVSKLNEYSSNDFESLDFTPFPDTSMSKIAFEVLEKSGEVKKIEEITKLINEKYPEANKSVEAVRAMLIRNKKLFIYFGRASTYGLRKWEKEKENIKGGTIREMVVEYLSGVDEPKHITEIMIYISKYRKTNSYSVLTSIKAENKNRFTFFNGGFIGLKNKNYNKKTLDLLKLKDQNENKENTQLEFNLLK